MKQLVAIAIVAILGLSLVGVGQMSSYGDNDGHKKWYNNFWGKDNKWFGNFWHNFDYKKFTGFLNTGGFGDKDHNDDDDDDGVDDDVDQTPVDSAKISFNIGIRDLNYDGIQALQNIVDQCIFSSEQNFDPVCVKCKFLDDDNTVVAKGEVIELDQSYAANTEIPISMISVPPADDGYPVSNDVRNVHNVQLSICGFKCVPTFASFTELDHGALEDEINDVMSAFGISVSGIGYNGINKVVIFDAEKSGTPDPDLEVDHNFRLLILPEKHSIENDIPNDSAAGGTIIVKMDTPKYLKSFVIVDHENDKDATAKAYDAKVDGNLVKSVKLPITGNGEFATVFMNAPNVQRLEVTYADSGGITNIDLKCNPPEQTCECEKPDKFIVTYHGPNGVKVDISKNGKDKVTLPGTYNDGEQIVVDAVALGFKNGKVYPETTYDFIKNGHPKGTITIHTSCSQTLYVGQEFYYKKGTSSEIQLTVVSGTLKGEPSIPDESCPVPPPECDCDKRKKEHDDYYDEHKKYYDDNKRKFSFYDYKKFMDDHDDYIKEHGKDMDKSDFKKQIDYFKKVLDDNKRKLSSSDYRKYSNDYKKFSDEYKYHEDSCKCGDDGHDDDKHDDDKNGKDHHDDDKRDDDKNDYDKKNKKNKNDKDNYNKDHDD